MSIRHAVAEATAATTRAEIAALFDLPFLDLVTRAHDVHNEHHPANHVERATLLSIKTGGCPEDCGYCSQSVSAQSGVKAGKLIDVDAVLDAARAARDAGASRFCMGAAWREPRDRDMPALIRMAQGVKALGLETCMTLGMLNECQVAALAAAGLDFYNHNIDTSPEYYGNVITTRRFEDRLDTLARVRASGIKLCCGGIIGMGESRADRVGLIHALASLPVPPESVPINALVPIAGTALGSLPDARIDEIEFARTIAVTRLCMPTSVVRLSAGRESMSDACQALCFLAGANSIFTGDRLLTTPNTGAAADTALLSRLGMQSGPMYNAARRAPHE